MESLLISVLCLAAMAVQADDRASVRVLHSPSGSPVDTLYIGLPYEFEISFEVTSSCGIDGIHTAFLMYSENGVTWSWDAQEDGYPDTGLQAVTFYPDGLFYPPEEVWNLFFRIFEFDMDGLSPDSLGLWLVTVNDISPLPMQAMMAFHFTPQDMDEAETGYVCIDSTYPFMYYDSPGKQTWPVWPIEFDGPFCWPVKRFIRGDCDMDGAITVSDAVEIIKIIFYGKPPEGPSEAGDANCDGFTHVDDAIYLINYIFRHGPAPGCPFRQDSR